MEKTEHPLCTVLFCECKGNEPYGKSKYIGSSPLTTGKAFCKCHYAEGIKNGLPSFNCS